MPSENGWESSVWMRSSRRPPAGRRAPRRRPRPGAVPPRRLSLATRSGLQVAVQGAGWSWPKRLDGISLETRPSSTPSSPPARGSRSPSTASRSPSASGASLPLSDRSSRGLRTGPDRAAPLAGGERRGRREGRDPTDSRRALDPAPGALSVHGAARAGDRGGLRAVRDRPQRPLGPPHHRRAGAHREATQRSGPPAAAAGALDAAARPPGKKRAKEEDKKSDASGDGFDVDDGPTTGAEPEEPGGAKGGSARAGRRAPRSRTRSRSRSRPSRARPRRPLPRRLRLRPGSVARAEPPAEEREEAPASKHRGGLQACTPLPPATAAAPGVPCADRHLRRALPRASARSPRPRSPTTAPSPR